MKDKRVLDNSVRMGILLKRVREQYEGSEQGRQWCIKKLDKQQALLDGAGDAIVSAITENANLKRLNARLVCQLKKKKTKH
tara:strand:- start:564 stop:806 length:243 start_codon:yes stop_codon:yes gene_type:complete